MAQAQQNITLSAPGFMGLNLEDSPIELNQQYATVANNAVIDSQGRLAARKALSDASPSPLPFISYKALTLGRVVDGDTPRVIAAVDVNNGTSFELWELENLDQELVTNTRTVLPLPAGYTLPSAQVQIISFAGRGIILVEGAEMLVMSGGVLQRASEQTDWIPPTDVSGVDIFTTFSPTCGVAAFGRLWVSGIEGQDEVLYYSDIRNPAKWLDLNAQGPTDPLSTAGAIDVRDNWPLGKDRIVGLAEHNNNLIVFGRESILVWGNPQGDPADVGGIFLADAISNIGLIDRDAIATDARDIMFMDDTGLRSLGRTIQEQSAAIGDLTRPVRQELQQDIQRVLENPTSKGLQLVYSPAESFVLIILRDLDKVWVCDTRQRMQDGSFRVTQWTAVPIRSALHLETSSKLMLGVEDDNTVLCEYGGSNNEFSGPFVFEYRSPILAFGDPSRLKIVKQVDYTVVSGQASVVAEGSVDYIGYRQKSLSRDFELLGSTGVDYGVQEYTAFDYGEGSTVIRNYRYNAGSSGENILIGFKVPMNGNTCSLAQINVQTKLGRIM